MHVGRIVFSQLLDFVPQYEFNKCVERYRGNRRVRTFSCWDQFLSMVFAQLTYRESLRDIETCLGAMPTKLYHAGIRGHVCRSNLADANERRDWRIWADFAQVLIATARRLYAHDDFGVELDHMAYVLDSSTIDLCLSLFPWARFRKRKGAIKLHTLMDLHGRIPSFIYITDGITHDLCGLDRVVPEPGAFYIFDRGYTDFGRLHRLTQSLAFFVTRAKDNLDSGRRSWRHVDKSTGLRADQTVVLRGPKSSRLYPDPLRRVRFYDAEDAKTLVFLTNNFLLPALTIARLYQCRWQVELFFKWIKQHLRIKAFYGTSPNAVKTQIWIAISVYLVVAILKKELRLNCDLNKILQILSISLFEQVPLGQLLTTTSAQNAQIDCHKQLPLFTF
jgi:hypothetical protein